MTQATADQQLAYEVEDETIFTECYAPTTTIKEAQHMLTSDKFEDKTTNTIPFKTKGMCDRLIDFYIVLIY